MFINVSEELDKARREGRAIGAFNTINLETTKAICSAAKKADAEIIIQTTPKSIAYAGLVQIFNIVKHEIEETGIRAAIHLDHGKTFDDIKNCIDIGYRSVMIDGSELLFEENVALTSRVVEYAHAKNVSVEAMIGNMFSDDEAGKEGLASLSTPEQTKKFVDLTGVDMIAVSVGNEHGAPTGEKLDIKLLKEISETVKIPIVLHGASGISDEDVNLAVKDGVSKINIDTLIKKAFFETLKNTETEPNDVRNLFTKCMESMDETISKKIGQFKIGG